jgi:hypothetical protein
MIIAQGLSRLGAGTISTEYSAKAPSQTHSHRKTSPSVSKFLANPSIPSRQCLHDLLDDFLHHIAWTCALAEWSGGGSSFNSITPQYSHLLAPINTFEEGVPGQYTSVPRTKGTNSLAIFSCRHLVSVILFPVTISLVGWSSTRWLANYGTERIEWEGVLRTL